MSAVGEAASVPTGQHGSTTRGAPRTRARSERHSLDAVGRFRESTRDQRSYETRQKAGQLRTRNMQHVTRDTVTHDMR